MFGGGGDLSSIMQLIWVQVAIASGESFFPSRARINAEVAEEVGNSRLIESSLATLHFLSGWRLRAFSAPLVEDIGGGRDDGCQPKRAPCKDNQPNCRPRLQREVLLPCEE